MSPRTESSRGSVPTRRTPSNDVGQGLTDPMYGDVGGERQWPAFATFGPRPRCISTLALEDRFAAWTHPPMLEEKGASVAGNRERNVVIAVFREKSKLERAVAKDDTVAATAEEVADEAIVVTKQSDGALTISRSHHSVGRSLATLTAKLMIALPLGFYGVLAFTGAGVEITAAS